MATGDKFVLDSKGLCLLCLSDVKTLGANRQLTSTTSFKMFLRYLKINIYQLSNFSSSVLSSMDGLDDNPVMVSLCRDCTTMTNKFSEMYTTWEKIRLQMDKCVQLMHNQMVTGTRDPVKMDEYMKRMKGARHPLEVINASIVENLRKEAMDKCSSRMNSSFPRVNLQNCLMSPGPNSNLGSLVISLPSRSHGNQELGTFNGSAGSEIAPNVPPPPVFTTQYEDYQQPSTSRELTSYDLTSQGQEQMHMDFMEGELAIKMERVNRLLDNPSDDTGEEDENEEEAFSYPEEDMLELEEELPYDLMEDGAVSSSSAPEAIPIPEDVDVEVFEEFVSDEEIAILPRTVRSRRSTAVQDQTDMFACPTCDKRFPSARSRAIHNSHHYRGTRTRSEQGQGHQGTVTYNSLVCSVCKRICKTKAGLINHLKSHTGERRMDRFQSPDDNIGHYKCTICANIFTQDCSRRTHMATFHTLQFLADYLPAGTNEVDVATAIEREMAKMIRFPRNQNNNGRNPVGCPHCDRKLQSTSNLRAHIIQMHHDKLIFT